MDIGAEDDGRSLNRKLGRTETAISVESEVGLVSDYLIRHDK